MKQIKILIKAPISFIKAFICFIIIFIVAAIIRCQKKKRSPRLVWCPIPLTNNKYWSQAMTESGFFSKTIMENYYHIHNKDDFDIYVDQLIKTSFLPFRCIIKLFARYYCFCYAIIHFDIFHIPFTGGLLCRTPLQFKEHLFFKLAGKKVVVIPFGGDAYMYSKIYDPCLHHALLISYPKSAIDENKIQKRIDYWTKHADVIVSSFLLDGLGRWDVLPVSQIIINTKQWKLKSKYSTADGKSSVVKVVHAPNHRGFKGTEFLFNVVEELKNEGLLIELLLLEKVKNDTIHRILSEEADILAEQFICTAYALSAIEGMACGLPILSNLENEYYTRIFRRYSYLNECPIVSTTPETLKENLRVLITNPELRQELGMAGRQYVEKYHSYKTALFSFGAMYDKIWHGKDVDLINLFHPLKSDYVKNNPIKHPLVESKLPPRYHRL